MGLLRRMNKNGNPGTLVASHPGNTNAVKYGDLVRRETVRHLLEAVLPPELRRTPRRPRPEPAPTPATAEPVRTP